MARHPYLEQPAKAFWSRGIVRDWAPRDLVGDDVTLLRADARVISAGSCFAANIVPHLEAAGYRYVRTETVPADDHFGYELYSAAYGNVYTPRQWLQTIDRAEGRFRPQEDRWVGEDGILDPFRPGLRDVAESEDEFDMITRSHLDRVVEAIAAADTFVFTLGLTEAWESAADGAVFPACPGTVAGRFDAAHHRFHNFTVAEVVDDMVAAIDRMRVLSPGLRVILTVSPVPLVATATGGHVLTATVHAKSVLRVAAEEVCRARPDVVYFPAYEIVTGPHSDGFFAEDRRTVTPAAIRTVVDVLLTHSEPPAPSAAGPRPGVSEALSRLLAERDCEEAMSDVGDGEGSPGA